MSIYCCVRGWDENQGGVLDRKHQNSARGHHPLHGGMRELVQAPFVFGPILQWTTTTTKKRVQSNQESKWKQAPCLSWSQFRLLERKREKSGILSRSREKERRSWSASITRAPAPGSELNSCLVLLELIAPRTVQQPWPLLCLGGASSPNHSGCPSEELEAGANPLCALCGRVGLRLFPSPLCPLLLERTFDGSKMKWGGAWVA